MCLFYRLWPQRCCTCWGRINRCHLLPLTECSSLIAWEVLICIWAFQVARLDRRGSSSFVPHHWCSTVITKRKLDSSLGLYSHWTFWYLTEKESRVGPCFAAAYSNYYRKLNEIVLIKNISLLMGQWKTRKKSICSGFWDFVGMVTALLEKVTSTKHEDNLDKV